MTGQPKKKLMAAMRERRQREGRVRVEVWVPKLAVKRLREFVRKLQAKPDGK